MSTATQPLVVPRSGALTLARDYAELTKLRVTTLIIMTAWCGYYFGALKSGVSSLSWGLFHALLGIGLVSGGTAALNEVMEWETDGRMRRTAQRPIPAGRLSLLHATLVGPDDARRRPLSRPGPESLDRMAGAGHLSCLSRRLHSVEENPPICTFVGAFPGAMPGVLGWTAARGQLEWGALVMFAIVFFWQFPHFYSIAWLYRQDYEDGGIRMLPVVEPDGKSTGRQILIYSLADSRQPAAHFSGHVRNGCTSPGALVLGIALLLFRRAAGLLELRPATRRSKQRARQLLQATVFYLPLLFALMMLNPYIRRKIACGSQVTRLRRGSTPNAG